MADAKGNAVVAAASPTTVTHGNAILVAYHSDGKARGKLRGEIGVNCASSVDSEAVTDQERFAG